MTTHSIRNTGAAWGWISIAFHWVGAAFIVVLLAHGWWMTELSARETRMEQYAWHASVGYFFLALTVVRLLWRWMNAVPAQPAGTPRWILLTATLGHWGLYLLMLAAAVSGWAHAGTMRAPLDTTLWGLVHVPALVTDPALHERLEDLHETLAWTLAALVVVHVAGALYHRVRLKDGVAERMLPWRH